MKTNIVKFVMAALLAVPLGFSLQAAAAAPAWDATGDYVVNMNYLGNDYAHDISLTQSPSGSLSGYGGSPAGGNVYTWVIDSGSVSGSNLSFQAHYTATADAVTPTTTMMVSGTIAPDGTISGTWSDNYQGGARSGTFATVSGAAEELDVTPTSKDQCKNNGWKSFTNPSFKNQGQCVSSVANGK